MTCLMWLALAPGSFWTLTLGGDIMLNGVTVGSSALEAVSFDLASADIAIANLEIPLTTSSKATPRKSDAELRDRRQFVLRADPAHTPSLAAAGIDAVSLANNHAMDFGKEGLQQMQKHLLANEIGSTGAGATSADAAKALILRTPSGYRVALVSYLAFVGSQALWKCTPAGPNHPGVASLDLGGSIDKRARKRLAAIVTRARQSSDFVIVGLHWGIERERLPRRYQVLLGRAFIEEGADLVWGHHPHVLQGAELYDGKPILYSTGNLISPRPGESALFQLKFEGRRLIQFSCIPFTLANGKVVEVEDKESKSRLRGFFDLGLKLRAAYPSKRAIVLG